MIFGIIDEPFVLGIDSKISGGVVSMPVETVRRRARRRIRDRVRLTDRRRVRRVERSVPEPVIIKRLFPVGRGPDLLFSRFQPVQIVVGIGLFVGVRESCEGDLLTSKTAVVLRNENNPKSKIPIPKRDDSHLPFPSLKRVIWQVAVPQLMSKFSRQ